MEESTTDGLVESGFLMFVGLWAMFIADEERLAAIEGILSSVIFATGGVVGVYMGLATWAQLGKNNNLSVYEGVSTSCFY